MVLEKSPTQGELLSIMGEGMYGLWSDLNQFITENYNMDVLWDTGGKEGEYEVKYRRGGKTLCTLYPREQGVRVLVILGKAEREKFEAEREKFTQYINDFYDNTRQYHDGRWLYIDLQPHIVEDVKRLVLIKRKPNKR